MSENEKQIQDLRTQFLNKLEDLDSGTFHTADINRVKSDDNYLRRFILHHDGNQDSAFNMLWETCEWRKKFGTNDISEKNVNMEILEMGNIYPYGKDKDGKTLLVFKSKKHFKGAYDFEDHKRCLVYWMERLERQENGEKISLFFDMDGATLSNMDMDYTKYLIGLFKNYYPHFLNYIIIFEMAWVLNAVFKVIKSLLPPKAVEKMKFVNKTSIKDYLDAEYSSKTWGVKDNFVYHFKPEEKSTIASSSISGEDNRKKVHFADGSFKQDQLNESGFEDSYTPVSSISSLGPKITPPDVMIFVSKGNEVATSLTLKNENIHSILYKIKTTSPEKFHVRPTLGILPPGASATVNIAVFPNHCIQSLQKEKFLIMSIATDVSDISQQEINELWKQTNEKDVNRQRLRCCIPQTCYDDVMKNGTVYNSQLPNDQKSVSKLSSDITKLNALVMTLKEELAVIKRQQRIIIIAFIILIFSLSYEIYTNYFNTNTVKQNCWAESKGSQY